MAYSLKTDVTWAQTYDQLGDQFRLWGVRDWEVRSLGKTARAGWQDAETRRVTVRWTSPGGQEHTLTMADQDRAQDNLRVIFLAVEALRLNELRGIGGLAQDYYLRLAAPRERHDPWEVLGLRPGASLALVDAAYRAKAKELHPDRPGGDSDAMAELNDAWSALRAELAS